VGIQGRVIMGKSALDRWGGEEVGGVSQITCGDIRCRKRRFGKEGRISDLDMPYLIWGKSRYNKGGKRPVK